MEAPAPLRIAFGDFELNVSSAELRRSGKLVKLHPQPLQVLVLLATRAGELVSREEIRKQIWQDDTFVDFDLGINSCIRQIRNALHDDSDKPRYIQTVPRRGYRFVASVEEDSALPFWKVGSRKWRLGIGIGVVAGALAIAYQLTPDDDDSPLPQASGKAKSFKRLTSQPGEERHPSLSPDGVRCLLARSRSISPTSAGTRGLARSPRCGGTCCCRSAQTSRF